MEVSLLNVKIHIQQSEVIVDEIGNHKNIWKNYYSCFATVSGEGGTDKNRIAFYKEELAKLQLGLEDKFNTKVGALSGGQRQALALLMSTMTPIDFLILDEHTAALDPKTADLIMELTEKIVREKQLTAIMVTHNLRYAVEYGDRLLMLHQGNAVMDVASEKKKEIKIEDILEKFNEISIECGN